MPRPPKPDKRRSNGDGGLWQLPNGRWRWEIVLGYVTTPEGNLSRKTKSGTAADKTAAKKDLTLARAAHLNNDLPPPNRITVSEWLENWIATRTKIRPNTLTNYKGYIKHIVPVIGSKRLQSLKPLDLENALYRILVGKEVSFRNLQGVHGVLYSAFSSAVKFEIVNRNVADIVRPEISFDDKPSRASTAWTAKEAETFLKVAREDKLYVVFYLFLSLGLRRGEVCGLRWEHVDLKSK